METIGQRIRQARKSLTPALTQREVAEKLGLANASVTQWELDITKPSGKNLLALAHVLQTTPEAILGIKEYRKKQHNADMPATGNDLHPTAIRTSVPVISSVQAGGWKDCMDNYHPGDGETWQAVTVSVGPHAYALRVEGKSMHNPNGMPSIPEGSIVVVDPDAEAINGKIVIAKIIDRNEVTIKRLSKDGADYYLEPLNPAYQHIKMDANHAIIGVVRQIIQEL